LVDGCWLLVVGINKSISKNKNLCNWQRFFIDFAFSGRCIFCYSFVSLPTTNNKKL